MSKHFLLLGVLVICATAVLASAVAEAPAVGSNAPEFTLTTNEGNQAALKDFRGKWVVLYFYPKDDTPGCTVQACGLRDAWSTIGEKANIFGVSVDSTSSHEKFIAKYQLPFPLLSDPEKEIVNAFGVWVEKSMYGKKYMGAERSTFVIGPDGRIAGIFRKVKPEEHLGLLQKALASIAK